jgi:hypothetical protein
MFRSANGKDRATRSMQVSVRLGKKRNLIINEKGKKVNVQEGEEDAYQAQDARSEPKISPSADTTHDPVRILRRREWIHDMARLDIFEFFKVCFTLSRGVSSNPNM